MAGAAGLASCLQSAACKACGTRYSSPASFSVPPCRLAARDREITSVKATDHSPEGWGQFGRGVGQDLCTGTASNVQFKESGVSITTVVWRATHYHCLMDASGFRSSEIFAVLFRNPGGIIPWAFPTECFCHVVVRPVTTCFRSSGPA